MANIKFSAFTAETDINNFDDIVGYGGVNNLKITPANLASSLINLSGGPYLPIAAGVANPLTGDLYIGDGTAPAVDLFLNTNAAVGDETQIRSQGEQFMYHEKGTSFLIGPNDDIGIDDSGSANITMSSTTTFVSDIKDINNSTGNVGQVLVSKGGSNNGVEWVNGYKAIQTHVWTNGSPVAYTNWTSGTPSVLPFDPLPTMIDENLPSGTLKSPYVWTCSNAAGGTAGQVATFTLGANGAGVWRITTCQHWFDQTSQVEFRASLILPGPITVDVVDEKSTELTGDKIFYGELVRQFSGGDTVQVECEFTAGGLNPFPSATGNRPIEITFEKIL